MLWSVQNVSRFSKFLVALNIRTFVRSFVSTMSQLEYYPQRIFSNGDFALVILGKEILLKSEFFFKIWNSAVIRHLVDSGADHFFQLYDKLPLDFQKRVPFPEIASGDFDSISKTTLTRLKESPQHCKVILTDDQEETDFTKGLQVLKEELQQTGRLDTVKRVVVVCESSGRIDQILGNFNTLHKNVFVSEPIMSQPQVYLLGKESLSWLLPGNYESLMNFEEASPEIVCGIIPLQGPTRYVSKGLKWDLSEDMECKFGGLISSSNQVVQKQVTIKPIQNHSVFCLELHKEKYVL